MNSDLKVSFYLKKNEVDSEGMCPVMGRIRVGKTEAPFGAKAKIPLSLWDTHSGRALGKSREATELNRKLDNMNVIIHTRYRELLKTRETVSAEQVKAAFQGIALRQATLVAYFKNYVETYEKRIGKDREASTLKELKSALNHVTRFLKEKYRITDIAFSSLTYSFIEDYDYHLRITLKLQSGTILGLISRLRRMVKYAINEGFISSDPFYEYKPIYPRAKQKYLTLPELESIINTPFENGNLKLAKDMFLFSCFTGLAYSDICNLTGNKIVKAPDGVLWIRTNRQKTGVPCNIPLLDLPVRIIEKYRGTATNGKLLPMTSNNVLNKHLKTVAERCGIKRNLIFHCLRHTFATQITLSQGVSIASIGKMLGHTSVSTTQIYAKITGQKVNEDMKVLSGQINGKYVLAEGNRMQEEA